MEQYQSFPVPVYPDMATEKRDTRILVAGIYTNVTSHLVSKRTLSEWVILLCAEGSGWFFTDNDTPHPLHCGEMVLLPAKVAHSYGNSAEGWTVLWLHCTGNILSVLQPLFCAKAKEKPFVFVQNGQEFVPVFHHIFERLQKADALYNTLFAESLLTQMLCQIAETAQTECLSGQQIELIHSAIRYIEASLEQPLCLDSLAKQFHISKYHFIRLFRQYTGDTPMEYCRNLRLKKACVLLANPRFSVAQISEMLGYATPYHFSNTFKSRFGISPSKYRKLL